MRTYQIVRLTCDSHAPRWHDADGGVAPGSGTLVARPPCPGRPAANRRGAQRAYLTVWATSPHRSKFFPRTGPARLAGRPYPVPTAARRPPATRARRPAWFSGATGSTPATS